MLRFLILFWFPPLLLMAQIDPVAEAIKSNVVAIAADFSSGNKEQGFGFVVGERSGILYLATAGHVVREDGAEPGKENANNIQVVFCGDDRIYPAKILKATISPFDFGLLELDKPIGYVWKADCLGSEPPVGTSVGYIGRNKTCFIPTTTVRGNVNTLGMDLINIDIIGVSRGTSGSPLIGPDGLIGMIVSAEYSSAEALTLERLQNEVTNGGNFPFRFGLRRFQVPNNTTMPSSPDIATYHMVKIDGGTFEMGCKPERDGTCGSDETPLHQVSISSFYLSKYEVTYQQFKIFVDSTEYLTAADKVGYSWVYKGPGLGFEKKMGINWRHDIKGQIQNTTEYQHPVIHISRSDAEAYCQWLSKHTGKTYRLPTEAEWEYAARGGKFSKAYRYAGGDLLREVAWYIDNSKFTTHVVGSLKGNEIGLYDMSGNVNEWCSDWYDVGYYKNSPNNNPQGPASGAIAVLRGGSWRGSDYRCCLAHPYRDSPGSFDPSNGFRLARNL